MAVFSHAIIVGASSGIGASLALQMAAQGTKVALVARREDALKELATQIGTNALIFPHDVMNAAEIPELFQKICHELGGLDVIVYSSGVMPQLVPDEYSYEKDANMVNVNCLGAVAWLNEAAQRFAQTQSGTIVGISSVAGDRGRSGGPVYGATKAFFDTYLEALRNRLGKHGVKVVTVKPGPVDTPMTQGMDKLPLLIKVDDAARQILVASQAGKRLVYVPGIWRLIMGVVKAIPSPIFQKLGI